LSDKFRLGGGKRRKRCLPRRKGELDRPVKKKGGVLAPFLRLGVLGAVSPTGGKKKKASVADLSQG